MQPVTSPLAAQGEGGDAVTMDAHTLRRRLLAGAALAPLVSPGNARAARLEQRDLGDFTSIEVGGGLAVALEQGRPPQLRIDADEGIARDIVSEVDGATLKLYPRHGAARSLPRLALRAWNIEALSLTGAAALEAQEFICKRLRLSAGGASRLKIAAFTAETLELEVDSAAQVTLGGRANDLQIEAGGASILNLSEFNVRRVKAELSGASRVTLWATDQLQGQASGGASLRYRGDPQLKVERSGGASVSRA